MDSDDLSEPEHLALRIESLRSNPQVDLLHGGLKIVGSEFVKDKNNPEKDISIHDCYVAGTFFGKRTLFETIHGFKNLKYSGESEFAERAILNGYNLKRLIAEKYKTYIYFRDLPDSVTMLIDADNT